ncbi:MAG: hypothetical protein TREMPRED_000615 [Tremellales sp. Tagirdzhanova-0007]|nr:MAG: hypothetical protein TREMPRED_000615 [Tremellales sp. Tagirdzhanova-0007]
MTRSHRPPTLPIPLSALFPPSTIPGPSRFLSSPSAALLGPLPPTSALHLALNWLALSDLPEYEEASTKRSSKSFARVLIITGPKDGFVGPIEEDDEDWLRDHGADYGIQHRLQRVDVRYCPTSEHVLLLLNLLSLDSKASDKEAHILRYQPPLVIFWDLGRLLMEVVGSEENLPPGEVSDAILQKEEMRSRRSVSLSHYMNILAAGRSAIEHLSSSAPLEARIQLVVLEPSFRSSSSLPLIRMSGNGAAEANMSTPIKERRVRVEAGLEWMFGGESVGRVAVAGDEGSECPVSTKYTLTFPAHANEHFHLTRRRCEHGEWSSATALDAQDKMVEGDQGGWRWEWRDMPS